MGCKGAAAILDATLNYTFLPHIWNVYPSFFQSPMGPLHGSRVKIRGHIIAHYCTLYPLSPRTITYRAKSKAAFYYRAMLCISAVYAVTRCLSVCPSVTFVSCAKTNKDTWEIFSPSSGQAILVFPYLTGWRYSDGNPPNGGVECKGGMKKWRIFDQYLALSQKRL